MKSSFIQYSITMVYSSTYIPKLAISEKYDFFPPLDL